MPRSPMTVVVPTRDRPEQLAACLAALRADLRADDQVVVSDSASVRRTEVERVASEGGAEYVRCDLKGASRARNTGLQAARHPQVAFVDDDMRVLPGWADALLAELRPDVAFVGGRSLAPEGFEGPAVSVTLGRPPAEVEGGTGRPYAASNNLLVDRVAFLSVGGFDERIGPGTWFEAGEDLELIDRLLAAGLHGRYAHGAAAVHEQWRGEQAWLRLQWAYGKGMGARAALAARRRPADGLRLLPHVLRLGGLLTMARRVLPGAPPPPEPVLDDSTGAEPEDVNGWRGPVLWRLGALLGLAVGLVRLPARRPAP